MSFFESPTPLIFEPTGYIAIHPTYRTVGAYFRIVGKYINLEVTPEAELSDVGLFAGMYSVMGMQLLPIHYKDDIFVADATFTHASELLASDRRALQVRFDNIDTQGMEKYFSHEVTDQDRLRAGVVAARFLLWEKHTEQQYIAF